MKKKLALKIGDKIFVYHEIQSYEVKKKAIFIEIVPESKVTYGSIDEQKEAGKKG